MTSRAKSLTPFPAAWCIVPSVLAQMEARLLDSDIMAAFDRYQDAPEQTKPDTKPYGTLGSHAVIPIAGPLQKENDFWSWFFGMASMQAIGNSILAALGDDSIHEILLQIDSPGGTLDGTDALAALVKAADSVKPVTAYVDGQMCSAAYWIGSQASLVLSEPTGTTGSIGTMLTLTNIEGALKSRGIEVTHLATGTLKTAGSAYKPLGESDRAYLESLLADFQSHFTVAVQDGRGLSDAQMTALTAEARVYVSEQAQSEGLIDGITRADDLALQILSSHPSSTAWDAGLKRRKRMTNEGASSMNLIQWAFGGKTEARVREFQRNNGLVPDGVVGNLTRAALGL